MTIFAARGAKGVHVDVNFAIMIMKDWLSPPQIVHTVRERATTDDKVIRRQIGNGEKYEQLKQ